MTDVNKQAAQEFVAKMKELPEEEQKLLRTTIFRQRLAQIAQENENIDGVKAMYRLLYGRKMPNHAEEMVNEIITAGQDTKGALIEAFRGSTKSTTMECFIVHQIGLHPERNNLVISSADTNGEDFADAVANIIEFNEGFKLAFPSVVPDKDVGWGRESGYEVKRTDIPYEKWRKERDKRGRKKTIIGASYKSRSIIGSHPDGVFLIDDYHDENNTRSAVELETALEIFVSTLMPMLESVAYKVIIGTPWTPRDLLAYLKSVGTYRHVFLPIYTQTESGEKLSRWREKFPEEKIEEIKQEIGSLAFARMYELDLTAAEGIHLRREWLTEYDYEKIDPRWPMIVGVDYASSADVVQSSNPDYTTIAWGYALPGGSGIVLVDGFRGRVSQAVAEEKLKNIYAMYPNIQQIGIEAVGAGQELYALLLRSSSLPITDCRPGRKSKGIRFEKQMAPMFETKRAWISNKSTPFLEAFKSEWVQFPNGEHDDTLDAVFWMLHVGAPHLMMGIDTYRTDDNPLEYNFQREKKKSPFAKLGRT